MLSLDRFTDSFGAGGGEKEIGRGEDSQLPRPGRRDRTGLSGFGFWVRCLQGHYTRVHLQKKAGLPRTGFAGATVPSGNNAPPCAAVIVGVQGLAGFNFGDPAKP